MGRQGDEEMWVAVLEEEGAGYEDICVAVLEWMGEVMRMYDGATVLTLMGTRCERSDNQKYDGATVMTLISIRCDRPDTQKCDGAIFMTLIVYGATVLTLKSMTVRPF